MAYGSPNSLDEVEPYMSQVRGGRQVTPQEVDDLKERYRLVGGKTPLLSITLAQAKALRAKLASDETQFPVYVGMKHWHPFIEDTVQEIVRDGAQSIIGIALAPHYSRLSIGGYEDAIVRGLSRGGSKIPVTMMKSWHTNHFLIEVLSKRVRDGLLKMQRPDNAVVLFTAHSLPKKMAENDDPYEKQLFETANLVATSAGIERWDFAFQSAGQPRENWLGPQIHEQINKLAGDGFTEILVCPIGFVSDHLEILYDLDVEAKQQAKSLGVRLDRTKSLNDDPIFIKALESVVSTAVKTELLSVPGQLR
jgi:protoporphyrin/coproporphyrin ferrochelatase